MIATGSRDGYEWLTSTECYSGTLLKFCPDLFLGRYLAITAIDSGESWPERERPAGWQVRGGIEYTTRLGSIDDIPCQIDGFDTPGYDEWYVFSAPAEMGEVFHGNPFLESLHCGQVVVFVNQLAFRLDDSADAVQRLVEMFWRQLKWVQPESYVADGCDCLMVVTRNSELLRRVRDRLERFESQIESI